MRKDVKLFNNTKRPITDSLHPLFGSGYGFAPDVNTNGALATLPEASATTLEQEDSGAGVREALQISPPYGREGMMPAPICGVGYK